MTFDPSKFSSRLATGPVKAPPLTTISETAPPAPPKPPARPAPSIAPGTVMVEDDGHAVHLKGAASFNYQVPSLLLLAANVTDKTIIAFDLDVVDVNKNKYGFGSGVGISPDAGGSARDDAEHFFNFVGGKGSGKEKNGINDSSLGAYTYPKYDINTLYTDSVPLPPEGTQRGAETNFLWQPGFYGLKINEDGKFLFACNNADNRLEVRDISTDGHAAAKIPIDYPMFVTLAPEGTEGASRGTRFVYVDSPKAGLVRIAWNLSNNTFGKPETITPASEFAYPRGMVYNVAAKRLFVCDTFNLDRSKVANQIAVIDPKSGWGVPSRFGKPGGVNPKTGGEINEGVFTCPLTIDADSKGALWVNDYYSCEVRKYDFDPASNQFTLERRVIGPNKTPRSFFYWMPDAPPTQVWSFSGLLRPHRCRHWFRRPLHQPADNFHQPYPDGRSALSAIHEGRRSSLRDF